MGSLKAGVFIQKSHYQQLADNDSKLAYLSAIMRLVTSAQVSGHQKSEIS